MRLHAAYDLAQVRPYPTADWIGLSVDDDLCTTKSINLKRRVRRHSTLDISLYGSGYCLQLHCS